MKKLIVRGKPSSMSILVADTFPAVPSMMMSDDIYDNIDSIDRFEMFHALEMSLPVRKLILSGSMLIVSLIVVGFPETIRISCFVFLQN